MTTEARNLLTGEFTDQLQEIHGIQPGGGLTEIGKLTHLDDEQRETAILLRDRIIHLAGGDLKNKKTVKAAVERLIREQSFTVMNRFAALRMCEERGLIQECVAGGMQSRGFKVYLQIAGTALGGHYDRYRAFINCVFDEIAVDLGVLFDRFSLYGLLFPRETALNSLLELLNQPDLKPVWAEDETIGWIYQYFNSAEERRAMRKASQAPRNSRELAVRNQFFTPRYVVEFLTDNTLGRIWYEMTQGRTSLKDSCRYLVRRLDEVFLGAITAEDRSMAEAVKLLQEGNEDTFPAFESSKDVDRIIKLAHCVDGYQRHPFEDAVDGEWWPWWRKKRILDGEPIENVSTQDLLDILFAEARADRHGGGGEVWEEPLTLQMANEIRRRVLESRREDLSQEELLKQPVFIPYRPMKDPREIRMLDPACGSMHFGLYAFDLFETIYAEFYDLENPPAPASGLKPLRELYETREDFLRDVPRLIIAHNIHGVDIDPRAVQIAGLSLWLRAQRTWKNQGVRPDVRPKITKSNIVTAEPMPGDDAMRREFIKNLNPPVLGQIVDVVFDRMKLAGEAGSLLKIEEEIKGAVAQARKQWKDGPKPVQQSLFGDEPPKQKQMEFRFDLEGVGDEQFWEQAEDRILAALKEYAEQAENGFAVRRRLFADDAARGFAFIEICRQLYDVVLMNPPFGLGLKSNFNHLKQIYRDSYVDLFACFISQGAAFCRGRLGAITSRSFIITKKLERFRLKILPYLSNLLDLGSPVMDDAMVESAAFTLDYSPSYANQRFNVIDQTNLDLKDKNLSDKCLVWDYNSDSKFIVDRRKILQLPNAKILYNLPHEIFYTFSSNECIGNSVLMAKQGMKTFDDFRFLRLRNEVSPGQIGNQFIWEPLTKGGPFAVFYSDLPLLVKWNGEGKELGEVNRQINGQTAQAHQASVYYRKAGATYSRRSSKNFGVRVLPAGCIIGEKGPAILPKGGISPIFLIGLCNSKFVNSLVHLQANAKQYDTGIIEIIPSVEFKDNQITAIKAATTKAIYSLKKFASHIEGDPYFISPMIKENITKTHFSFISLLDELFLTINYSLKVININVDDAYGIDSNKLISAIKNPKGNIFNDKVGNNLISNEYTTHYKLTDSIISYLIGSIFGLWDIRSVFTDRSELYELYLTDIFSPLPVCPPGQLKSKQDLPSQIKDLNSDYPIGIAWNGVLVDDAGIEGTQSHPDDIVRRVREVLDVLWKDRTHEIEQEACGILGVPDLRAYFGKPSGFFQDHLKRYSKSRRKAPIYWPLSTQSGDYTLWIYYHRLTDQTLFTCVEDYINPKLEDVAGNIEHLQQNMDGGGDVKQRRRLEKLQDFKQELEDLKEELLRVAALPYKPDLNDGVLITACPLWKLFRLKSWQKDLKACWEKLAAGEYDWAHLACSIWPDRVKEKCRTDRSIAIAHDLEDLCEVEVKAKPKARKKRGKA